MAFTQWLPRQVECLRSFPKIGYMKENKKTPEKQKLSLTSSELEQQHIIKDGQHYLVQCQDSLEEELLYFNGTLLAKQRIHKKIKINACDAYLTSWIAWLKSTQLYKHVMLGVSLQILQHCSTAASFFFSFFVFPNNSGNNSFISSSFSRTIRVAGNLQQQ